MPSGGAELYFFYINFYADDTKYMDFVIRVNGADLCYARADMNEVVITDNGKPSCGAVAVLTEGMDYHINNK